MKIFYRLVIASVVLTSCKKELEPQDASAVTETAAIGSAAPTNLPVQPNTQSPVATSGAQGLNPEHGMPGHRCDIAVGAPLGGQPAAAAPSPSPTQTTQVTPQTMTTTSTPAATKTTPGMNPPHGQPGHRCDISVGAPLNSAPAKPAATTSKTTINSDGTVSGNSNVKITNSNPAASPPELLKAPTKTTAPGMNPPHGEPGHQCGVEVGAPLPK